MAWARFGPQPECCDFDTPPPPPPVVVVVAVVVYFQYFNGVGYATARASFNRAYFGHLT